MRFTGEAFEAAGREVSEAEMFNKMLDELASRRMDRLPVSEAHLQSKVAWKYHVQQQAFVHRLCDLAEPAIDEWMRGRTLAALILGRALVETVAVLHVFVRETQRLTEDGDVAKLDDWVMKVLFGGRYKEWGREYQAINVLTALDKLGKELDGVRDHYENLSEAVHPNAQGLGQFYSDTSTLPEYVDFSVRKRRPAEVLPPLTVSISLVGWALELMDLLDVLSPRIADLQRAQ